MKISFENLEIIVELTRGFAKKECKRADVADLLVTLRKITDDAAQEAKQDETLALPILLELRQIMEFALRNAEFAVQERNQDDAVFAAEGEYLSKNMIAAFRNTQIGETVARIVLSEHK